MRRKTGPARGTPGPGGKPTHLQAWLDTNGYTSAQLEAKMDPPIARQDMTKIRGGRDVTRKTMIRILRAARQLDPHVQMGDLFDLDPNSPLNQL